MAVIQSQAEFKNAFLADATVYAFAQLNSFRTISQVQVSFVGLLQLASSLNHCVIGWASLSPFKGIGTQDYLSNYARLFGVNFRQDADKIYIRKSDLPELIPKANNTAQSLFVALLLRILLYESNDLISLVNVYRWNTSFVAFSGIARRLTVLVVEVNVPAKYKYVDVEIINAGTNFSPNEL